MSPKEERPISFNNSTSNHQGDEDSIGKSHKFKILVSEIWIVEDENTRNKILR